MNLVNYIDNRFQEVNLAKTELGAQLKYDLAHDAEINALQKCLTGVRWLRTWLWVPRVVINFTLVKLGVLNEPKPVMMDLMKAKVEAEKIKAATAAIGTHNALAKSVGMMDKLKVVESTDARDPAPKPA